MGTAIDNSNLYDTDLYLWSQTNAQLLKQGRFSELDIEHLIEEVEDMGKSEQRGIKSYLRVLLTHLLKWEYQPIHRSGSWLGSIRNARREIDDLLDESPSLNNKPSEFLSIAYMQALEIAADETGLNIKLFPSECPYTVAQILDKNWLPT